MRPATFLSFVFLSTASCSKPTPIVEHRVYAPPAGIKPSAEEWQRARATIDVRLHKLGIRGATLEVSGLGLEVGLPKLSPEAGMGVDAMITRMGKLEFLPARATTLATRTADGVELRSENWEGTVSEYWQSTSRLSVEHAAGEGALVQRLSEEDGKFRFRSWVVDREQGMSLPSIADAQMTVDQFGKPEVGITFDAEGGASFARVTEATRGRPLLIVVDGEVMSAPIVRDVITGGKAVVTLGGATMNRDAMSREADRLAAALRSGPLPFPLEFRSRVDL